MEEGSPSLRKDGFRFFGRKTDSPASARKKVSKERETTQDDEGNSSPRVVAQPAVKLSDVSLSEFNPNAALSNFRARRKTISEYLAPLTGLFGPRRISALERLSYRPSPTKLSPAEDERRRVKELLFGTPMRRFSLNHAQNIMRSGTLRVRIISCVSPKLKSNTTISKTGNNSPNVEIRKISGESNGSNSSTGATMPPALGGLGRHLQAVQRKRLIQYYVEMELGAARGRTQKKEKLKASRRGEVRWDDSNAWVRLFVPGMEEGGDPILLAVSEAAKQVSSVKSRRPLQVLYLRVVCVVRGNADDDSEVHMPLFETALELDRLISKGAPRLWELPLISKDDPEDDDLGVLTVETRFERLNPRKLSQENLLFVEAAENLAAETASVLILAGQTPNLNLDNGNDDDHSAIGSSIKAAAANTEDKSALSPILMVPSAAAYLTTVAAGLVPTTASTELRLAQSSSSGNSAATARLSRKLRILYEHDENLHASWPLAGSERARGRMETVFSDGLDPAKKRRFSCPQMGLSLEGESELLMGANTEQLESLREGWRMWRMAHRSQLQPSHRAQDLAFVGERFINRANSSVGSPLHSMSVSPRSPNATSSTTFSFLEGQKINGSRMRALFELGGDSYDVSNYLEDHPNQRAFFNSVSARVGKIAMLEQQASFQSDEGVSPKSQKGLTMKKKPSRIVIPTRPWCRKKVAVLTGATSGIGEVIGRELCAKGIKRLILLVRNLSSGRSKALEWTEKYKNVEVDIVHCDLADMQDTNAATGHVRGLLSPGEKIDLLILCAACVSNESTAAPRKEFEETFAVNFMSNFLLVHALFDLMDRSSEIMEGGANKQDMEGRIIFAGCAAVPPFGNKVDLDDLQAEKKGIGQLGVSQYIHTKVMLLCFASELARRLGDRECGVTANVFFPGAVKSRLADRVLEAFNPIIARLADAAYGLTEGILVRSPEQGATLGLHLCMSSEVCGVNGKVFHSGVTGQITDLDPHPHFGVATNTELCRKLWAIAGKMLNQALGKESRVAEWWDYFKPIRPKESRHSQVAKLA